MTTRDDTLRLMAIVDEVRKLWDGMPVSVVALFLAIAEADAAHERLGITEAGERCGMTLASASRNILLLAHKRADRGHPPLEVVAIKPFPGDFRRKMVVLTPKGRLVFERLCKLVRP